MDNAAPTPAQPVAPAASAKPVDAKVAADPKATKPATPAATEPTEEYVVNGKKVQLTKSQAKIAVQKGLLADEKLQSIAALKSGTEALINAFKTPEGIIGLLKNPKLGANPKEVFKKLMASDLMDAEMKQEMGRFIYENEVRPSRMTPEQIQYEKEQRELAEYRKRETEARKAAEKAKEAEGIKRAYDHVNSLVVSAIQTDNTFPQTEAAVRAVFDKLKVMNKNGIPVNQATINKALALVKLDYTNYQISLLDNTSDDEQLIKLIGPERAKRIAKTLAKRFVQEAKEKEKAKLVDVPKKKNMNSRELKAYLAQKARELDNLK